MKDTPEQVQLQLWNGKAYVPTGRTAYTNDSGFSYKSLAKFARTMMLNRGYTGFRVAKASRPLKPKYSMPRGTASSRSVEDVQQEYLRWAQSKGLASIHIGNRMPLNSSPERQHRNAAGKIVTVPAVACIFTGSMLPYVEHFEEFHEPESVAA